MRKVGKEEFMKRIKSENVLVEKVSEGSKSVDDPKIKSLVDLNQILFNQLDVLNNNLSPEDMKSEIEKTKAIVNVSQTIINNAKILLDADKHFMNQSDKVIKVLTSGEGTRESDI